MCRFDNLFDSPWLNVKLGKFELDNIISEKRIVTLLRAMAAAINIYHFIPVGDGNIFGQIGDNQLGVEWMGHSMNDRTRLSAALVSSTDGNLDLQYGSNSYSAFFAGSHAFDVGKLGTGPRGFLRHGGRGSDNAFLTSWRGAIRGLRDWRTRPLAARALWDCSTSASWISRWSRSMVRTVPGSARVMAI